MVGALQLLESREIILRPGFHFCCATQSLGVAALRGLLPDIGNLLLRVISLWAYGRLGTLFLLVPKGFGCGSAISS